MTKNPYDVHLLNISNLTDKDDDEKGNGGIGTNGNNGGGLGGLPGQSVSITPGGNTAAEEDNLIQDILINYSEKAKQKLFSEAFFRDREINQVLGVLRQKKKSNALLKGEAGVGKTQLVQEIARRLDLKDPVTTAALGAKTVIYELPLGKILSGSSFVGQLEQKLYAVVDFASNPDNHVVLFIDEIHTLMGGGANGTYDKIAQILKTSLSSGQLRVIGATTIQEATTFLADPAFNRRWAEILIPELSVEQSASIVKNIKFDYEKHHNVILPDHIIPQLVTIGDQFKVPGSHRPDSTVTLLDKAMSDAWLKRTVEKHESANDPVMQAFIQANPQPALSLDQIKKSALTLLTSDESVFGQGADELQANFDAHIIGQDDAKKHVVDAVRRLGLRLTARKRPSSFLFAGPSGTGKTQVAKEIAKGVFGSEDRMVYINMSEYTDPSSLTRIIGSSAGYIGSESKRELPFDTLETNPYQLVLLDEFEKASLNVQRFFMQALDEGYVKTNRNKTIDFSRALIIATTNAGATEMAKPGVGFTTEAPKTSPSDIIKQLEHAFEREMLNRFEKIVAFEGITRDQYIQILRVKYNQIVAEALENRNDLTFSPQSLTEDEAKVNDTLKRLADESYTPLLNGRPAERTIREHIENTILANVKAYHFDLL